MSSSADTTNPVGTNNLEPIPDQILPNRVRIQPLLPITSSTTSSAPHNRRVKRIAIDDGPSTSDPLNHSLDGVTIPPQRLDNDAVDMLAECGGGVSVTSVVSPTAGSIPANPLHALKIGYKGVSFPQEQSNQPNNSLPSKNQSTEKDQIAAVTQQEGFLEREVNVMIIFYSYL